MSYFPNAYKKVFVSSMFLTDGKEENFSHDQYGFFDARTWTAIAPADANVTSHPQVVLSQGSHHNVDKVGSHGGYQENVKSQVIRPHLIHRFWKVGGRSARQQIVQLGWDGANAGSAPQFICGQNYSLRIDLKGSPALRFLGHNLSHRFDVFTGCCADADNPDNVDPVFVLLQLARQINTDPVFANFIYADVITTDGADAGTEPDVVNHDTYVPLTGQSAIDAAIAALRLTVAYAESVFLNCTFDPRDHFELEPLVIAGAQLVDETGDPCPKFKQLTFTETQAARSANGTGEQVLRDLIESYGYRHEVYQADPRKREIELNNRVMTNQVFRNQLHDNYYILHSVDRKTNPSGIYDNDQYLIQVSVGKGAYMDDFIQWVNNYMSSVSPGMAMEDLSGDTT